jgi:hypothetical protein
MIFTPIKKNKEKIITYLFADQCMLIIMKDNIIQYFFWSKRKGIPRKHKTNTNRYFFDISHNF